MRSADNRGTDNRGLTAYGKLITVNILLQYVLKKLSKKYYIHLYNIQPAIKKLNLYDYQNLRF